MSMNTMLGAILLLVCGSASAQTHVGQLLNPGLAHPANGVRACSGNGLSPRKCLDNGLVADDGKFMSTMVVMPDSGKGQPQILLLEQIGDDINTASYLIQQTIDFPKDVKGGWTLLMDNDKCVPRGVAIMLLAPSGKQGLAWKFDKAAKQLVATEVDEFPACDIAPQVKDL